MDAIGKSDTFSLVVNAKAGIPTVAHFQGLMPESEYTIAFRDLVSAREGRVRTFSENPESLNLAVVSCNYTSQRKETNLWAVLRDRYVNTEDVQMILHVGDQIYGDNAFDQAMLDLRGKRRGSPALEARIIEHYRELYRLTWQFPETADVLATVPNLMIWDDHDIRDDWGSRDADKNPQSPEYYVGTLARRAFREYQRQLWDDRATEPPTSGFEHHFHAWGRIGVLFVDQRGGRSFQTDLARPYLGTPQWEDIVQAVESGILSQCDALVVATSVPLAYMGSGVTAGGVPLVDDLLDHWALPAHQKEQVEFIRLLRRWKEAGENRDLLIVGGDVHLGGYTDIKHNEKVIFRQLISSPITNKPPRWFERLALKGLLELNENLGMSYSFEHRNITGKRNFGIAMLRTPVGAPTYIQSAVVT